MRILNKFHLIYFFLILNSCQNKVERVEKKFEDFVLREDCYLKEDDDILDLTYWNYRAGNFPSFTIPTDKLESRISIYEKNIFPHSDLKYYTLIKEEDKIISIDDCFGRELIYQLDLPEPLLPFQILKLGFISKLDYFILFQRKSTQIKTVILERNGKRIKYNFPMKNN